MDVSFDDVPVSIRAECLCAVGIEFDGHARLEAGRFESQVQAA